MTRFIFSLGIFVGSFLLFLIQPMVGKILLPGFGGVPAVWTTCMLFFQAALLAVITPKDRSAFSVSDASRCCICFCCCADYFFYLSTSIFRTFTMPCISRLSGCSAS